MCRLPDIQHLISEHEFLMDFPEVRKQLQKDLYRSGISYTFLESDIATFIPELQVFLSSILKTSFTDFVNLLYTVDVSEKYIRYEGVKNSSEIVKRAIVLLLKREWDKVRLRNDIS